ncbi:MAG: oligosaccharide flippase family protein [Bacteroidales bacterium]|nr:oligosaccharide flippase family protein [Bacteroidales bacterium]
MKKIPEVSNRFFSTNLFLLLLLNLIVKPFWIFGIDRSAQNALGASDYGLYYALFNFTLIFNILLDCGVTNFNNREISFHPQLAGKYFANILSIKLMLSVVYVAITVAVALGMGYGHHQLGLLFILAVNQFLSSLVMFIRSNLNALHHFGLDSVLSVLDKLIMILLGSVLLWTPLRKNFTIEAFAVAQTLSYMATVAVSLIFLTRTTGRLRIKFDRVLSLSMLKNSLPYALMVLLMTAYSRLDSVVIDRLLPNGSEAAGIYAQAFRLLDAANMLPFLFASLLLPIFSGMIKQKREFGPFLNFSFLLLVVPVVAIAIPTIAHRAPIINLLYHEHVDLSAPVLGLLMISYIFISVGYVFGTLLTANGNIKELNIVSGAAVVVCLSVQITLVPRFGVIGAAIGNMVVNFLVAVAQVTISLKKFRLTPDRTMVFRFLAYLLFCPLATVFILNLHLGMAFSYVLSIIASLGFALILKLIDIKQLLATFTTENTPNMKG